MKRCIVFDLDETLIYTHKRQFQVIKDFFQLHNFPFNTSPDEYLFYRKSRTKTNTDFVKSLNHPNFDLNLFGNYYSQSIESPKYLSFDELIVDLNKLKQLKKSYEVSLIILSLRTNNVNSINQIRNLGIADIFDRIIFQKHNSTLNPKTLSLLELKKEYEILHFIGDSYSDYHAAIEARVPFIKVDTGIYNFQCEESSFSSINQYLNKSNHGI